MRTMCRDCQSDLVLLRVVTRSWQVTACWWPLHRHHSMIAGKHGLQSPLHRHGTQHNRIQGLTKAAAMAVRMLLKVMLLSTSRVFAPSIHTNQNRAPQRWGHLDRLRTMGAHKAHRAAGLDHKRDKEQPLLVDTVASARFVAQVSHR